MCRGTGRSSQLEKDNIKKMHAMAVWTGRIPKINL